MPRNDGAVLVENAQVRFLNFSGREDKFNREGDRNLCVLLSEQMAADLADQGYNIKFLRAREEGEQDQPYIKLTVKFKVKPPRIVMVGETSRKRTELGEELCGILDDSDIVKCDVSFTPYDWDVNGNKGRTAYLKQFFCEIEEDYLTLKWSNIDVLEPEDV
jgi:hypothetical protein